MIEGGSATGGVAGFGRLTRFDDEDAGDALLADPAGCTGSAGRAPETREEARCRDPVWAAPLY